MRPLQEPPAYKVTRKPLLRPKKRTMCKGHGCCDHVSFLHANTFSLMPWDKERYPPDWDERAKARKEQAGWTCELCGAKQGEERWGKVNGRYSTIWLAAAHLHHDPENPHAKLAVFCQACHMKYDGYLHVSNSWRTRYQRQRVRMLLAGQLQLFDDDECSPENTS